MCFNPRAPRGARRYRTGKHCFQFAFQSARPAWGATLAFFDFYPVASVSIRAPRVGRDSMRRISIEDASVSIRAPRVGRDQLLAEADGCTGSFNPRAPRGARPDFSALDTLINEFQSARPAWGATAGVPSFRLTDLFQSARPAWGATSRAPNVMSNQEVSIRAPRVGRDGRQVQREQGTGSFNPRAPRGARLQKLLNYFCLNISNAYSAKFKKSGVNNMTSRRLEFSKNYRSTAFAKSDPIQKSLIAWGSRCNQTINV